MKQRNLAGAFIAGVAAVLVAAVPAAADPTVADPGSVGTLSPHVQRRLAGRSSSPASEGAHTSSLPAVAGEMGHPGGYSTARRLPGG
jgi:hypothetical protein